jgi:hypothetical protein
MLCVSSDSELGTGGFYFAERLVVLLLRPVQQQFM